MSRLSYLVVLLVSLVVAGCGDSDTLAGGNTGGGTNPGGADVAGVNVLSSSPSLPSDPGQELTISVIVRRCQQCVDGGRNRGYVFGFRHLDDY